jgi:hypothetical protein
MMANQDRIDSVRISLSLRTAILTVPHREDLVALDCGV